MTMMMIITTMMKMMTLNMKMMTMITLMKMTWRWKWSISNQCDVWAQTTVKTSQLKSRVSMVPPKIVPGWQVYSYTTPPFGVKTWVDSQISSQCHPTLCPSPDILMRKCLWSYITIELISIVSNPIKVVVVVVPIVVKFGQNLVNNSRYIADIYKFCQEYVVWTNVIVMVGIS